MSAALAEPRILVSLPTYNERDNIAPLIREIHRTVAYADVLIVDDNSPDGTGELADQLAANDPRVRVLHGDCKRGLGTTLLQAMRYALSRPYDLLVIMDADFSHHPRHLPALLAGMDRYDVMIGSRYTTGGHVVGWSAARRLMSHCVNVVDRLILRLPARDTSGGYRCYRLAKLRHVKLNCLLSRGYSFQQEILHHCMKVGCRIGETPISFESRHAGVSKLGLQEALRSISVILWVAFRNWFSGNSNKARLPD